MRPGRRPLKVTPSKMKGMGRSAARWSGGILAMAGLAACAPAATLSGEALPVIRVDPGEANAALRILERVAADRPVPAPAWDSLFATTGYRRLQEREQAMGRSFEDRDFRSFLLADSTVARLPELRSTLEEWSGLDVDAAGLRAATYLPPGGSIRATMYPVIKPAPNSFVFDLAQNPAIFIYVDPEVSRAELQNILAHELHHVGYAQACIEPPATGEPVAIAVGWTAAFGEGLAMLAAAGSPDTHPHADSDPEDRARWDRDMANVHLDLHQVEQFLASVADGSLADPLAIQERARSFYGTQGPWYTVGWLMASTIEREFGRERLIATICSPPAMMRLYNHAAQRRNAEGDQLPVWSAELIDRLDPRAAAPRAPGPIAGD